MQSGFSIFLPKSWIDHIKLCIPVHWEIKIELMELSGFADKAAALHHNTDSTTVNPILLVLFVYILLARMASFEFFHRFVNWLFVSIIHCLIGCVKVVYHRLQFMSFIWLVKPLIVHKIRILKNRRESSFCHSSPVTFDVW